MKNTNTQIDISDMQLQVYDYKSIDEDEVLKKATEIAYVYVPDAYEGQYYASKYKNIKKVHIFTSIDNKKYFKSVQNNSHYKVWFVDEKDPLKNCDEKFDCIIIHRNHKGFNCILSEDAIKHLKDENSAVIDRVDSRGARHWYVYKLCKQQVNNPINF